MSIIFFLISYFFQHEYTRDRKIFSLQLVSKTFKFVLPTSYFFATTAVLNPQNKVNYGIFGCFTPENLKPRQGFKSSLTTSTSALKKMVTHVKQFYAVD